ncbi:VOC family protein [Pseudonocardia ailaonensis]|uniref:VOC family protein n=1 Tax=Pseudonocardia ailaonensis TaxID=367279 RepID=A0ABN2N0B3_9PSEU
MEILAGRVLLRPSDPDATTAFYRDVLGLAVYREFPGGTVFFLGGGYLEVSAHGPDPEAGRPGVALWMQVRDIAAAHAHLLARGATVEREPRREPWGLDEMWVRDPDGVRIGVVEVPVDHPIRADLRRPADDPGGFSGGRQQPGTRAGDAP